MRRFDNRQPEEHLIWIESVTRDIREPLALEIEDQAVAYSAKEDLYDWIATASSGLCEEAENRVEREIKDHYADAMYEHIDAGKSLLEAHRTAIEALGDPRHARRTFRQTYMTCGEHAFLQKILKPSKSEWIGFTALWVVIYRWHETSVGNKLLLIMLPVILAFMVVHHIISSRMSSRRVLAWSALTSLGAVACCFIAASVLAGNVYVALIMALYGAVWIRQYIKLWSKVGRDLLPEEKCQSQGNGNESV